ncbi:MAG: hypothetical protein KI790_19780, partial [Cyclobacteriaceae bacterium]|nr:hypothetical protein [Cyclobacteriaceae bacterium HetDA_MAG_MS6]
MDLHISRFLRRRQKSRTVYEFTYRINNFQDNRFNDQGDAPVPTANIKATGNVDNIRNTVGRAFFHTQVSNRGYLRRLVGLLTLVFLGFSGHSQNSVGIGTETPNPNAVLELVSPTADQGFLVPRMTTAQRTDNSFVSQLTSTDNGLMVFDTDDGAFYFWLVNQWFPMVGTQLSAGNGILIQNDQIVNTGDLDSTNEIQDISLNGSDLILSEDATPVDLAPFLDNTDAQTLALAGTDLSVSNGNTVSLASIQDGTGTDNQDLALSGNSLTLTNDTSPVDLTGYLDNTDGQGLSYNDVSFSLSIDNGNSVDLSSLAVDNVDDADADAANELLSGAVLNGTDLELTDAGGTTVVALASLQDGTGTDNQDLALSGNSLTLTNDASPVDLTGFLDNTDAQTLSYNDVSYSLSIGNGNSVDLSSLAVDNVDDADADAANELLSGAVLNGTD